MMERRERASKIILGAFAIFFLWSLLLVISPVLLPSNSVEDLSGLTAVIDNENNIVKMPFPINWVYEIGDRLCHQKEERSFFINGNQMPFCSRCTAIWIGLTAGIGILIAFKLPLDKNFLFLSIISLIPIGVDGTGQLIGLWESTQLSRFVTGFFTGLISGLGIVIIIDELKTLKKSKTS